MPHKNIRPYRPIRLIKLLKMLLPCLAAVMLTVLFTESLKREIPEFEIEPPTKEYKEESRTEYSCERDDTVDFLQERLPQTTPDPQRDSFPVEEIDGSGEKKYSGIAVSDSSDSGLDIEKEMKTPWSIGSDDITEPTVLIYHTHSCESFSTGFTGFYYSNQSFRSEKRNISEAGEKMAEAIRAQGIGVIHDTRLYDSPNFDGAYGRSMDSVMKYLEDYPGIRVTIDLHRDSMVASDGTSYKPVYEIGGRKAAQIMLLAGADPTGELGYENWYDNFIFNLKIQMKAEELYPGLMRPIMFCQRLYNYDATNCSLLVELGTESNTFFEANYSAELFGEVLGKLIKGK